MTNEQEWNNALDELHTCLKNVLSYATKAIDQVYELRHRDYGSSPVSCEVDYLALRDYMETLDKFNSNALYNLKWCREIRSKTNDAR
ncbi:MAG: hypothetical protein IKE69_11470 [Thermoguttaceae bacterium]|nr:hypothetical protein [Thermoguttaceae bacterium]